MAIVNAAEDEYKEEYAVNNPLDRNEVRTE